MTQQQKKFLKAVVTETLSLSDWAGKDGPIRTLQSLERKGLIEWKYQQPVATEAGRSVVA